VGPASLPANIAQVIAWIKAQIDAEVAIQCPYVNITLTDNSTADNTTGLPGLPNSTAPGGSGSGITPVPPANETNSTNSSNSTNSTNVTVVTPPPLGLPMSSQCYWSGANVCCSSNYAPTWCLGFGDMSNQWSGNAYNACVQLNNEYVNVCKKSQLCYYNTYNGLRGVAPYNWLLNTESTAQAVFEQCYMYNWFQVPSDALSLAFNSN
jgi:hypothetical protein